MNLYHALEATSDLDRVVDWAAHKVTMHPALLEDLRLEIKLELTQVPAPSVGDHIKLGATVARRVTFKFKARLHGPLSTPSCAEANQARSSFESNYDIEAMVDSIGTDDQILAAEIEGPGELNHERLRAVLDRLSPALYRVARHIVRGQNMAFIAAAEGLSEASVRTLLHRIENQIQELKQ
jgi:DNA-binding CsgD family transcriptional regulator